MSHNLWFVNDAVERVMSNLLEIHSGEDIDRRLGLPEETTLLRSLWISSWLSAAGASRAQPFDTV